MSAALTHRSSAHAVVRLVRERDRKLNTNVITELEWRNVPIGLEPPK